MLQIDTLVHAGGIPSSRDGPGGRAPRGRDSQRRIVRCCRATREAHVPCTHDTSFPHALIPGLVNSHTHRR